MVRLEAGAFLALGEYRMSKAEMLNWVDKKNGQAKSAPILRHVVEFGSSSCCKGCEGLRPYFFTLWTFFHITTLQSFNRLVDIMKQRIASRLILH